MFNLIASAVSAASGIKGLFSGSDKPKTKTPRDNMVSMAKGAREVSERWGFNPLTMLQFGGGTGFTQTGGGGAPPLASVAAITEGLRGIDDVVSGDAARRRAADELELDLARVKLDQARSGVIVAPNPQAPVAAAGVSGPSPLLGRQSVVAGQSTAAIRPPRFSAGENPLAPGRKIDIAPLSNGPGVIEIENAWTPFGSITVPGDGGEPWGFSEVGTVVAAGLPQIVAQGLQAGSDAIKDRFWGGKSYLEYKRDQSEDYRNSPEGKAEQAERDRVTKTPYKSPWRNF